MRFSIPLCVNDICRLDAVCLSLAVMPDRTVLIVYRLIFFLPLLPHFTQSDSKILSVFRNSVIKKKKKSDNFVKSSTFLSKKKSKTFSPCSGNHGSIFMLPATPNQSCVACLCLTRREWKIRFIMCASIQCEMEREGITQTSPAHNCACNVEA